MSNELKTLKLTYKQCWLLADILDSTEDCGPQGESWKSIELVELINSIDEQLKSTIKKGK